MNSYDDKGKELYWSRYAADFDEMNYYVAGTKNLKAIKEAIADSDFTGKVLELGCGSGLFTEELVKSADNVVATDLSDEMVAVSMARFLNSNKVTVKKENCFSLSFPDECFDSVIMVNLLHVIPAPEAALLESRRVLKRNGRIVIISFTMEGMSFLDKLGMMYRYLRTYGTPPPTAQTLTTRKTESLLCESCFKIEESKLIGRECKAVFVNARKI